MRIRVAAAALVVAALAAAIEVRAQHVAPRDIWPQATAAAREGDFDTAKRRTSELITTGAAYGIRLFPLYAGSATGLASEFDKDNAELATWAASSAEKLDGRSPGVKFNEADRAARNGDWGTATSSALNAFVRAARNYRSNLLSRANLLIVAAIAAAVTAAVFAIALLFRYGRSMAHDFREILGGYMSGGTVSVLAFALLFLPLFLWLGPMWLVFYWFTIFFGYAGRKERITIAVILLIVALLPVGVDAAANWIAGVESPVLMAAISSKNQSYQPEALRRLQELIAVIPDHPTLHLLVGNMHAFEGFDDQAAIHYRRAIELQSPYAGAHVNLGNLLFINGESQAAMSEYEKAQKADSDLAIAYYNHSVASGETYKFDQQARMLERARDADRFLVERLRRSPPPQKIVMYNPPLSEAWEVADEVSQRPAARGLFGNYSRFEPLRSAANPITLGALLSLVAALGLFALRRRSGFANACIKCGRTFCYRCKSARESTTYCTQCIHIYLKRDGVSLETKRKKLEEVTAHQNGMTRRNRLFATFLPGSAQMMQGKTVLGAVGVSLFALFVATAIFVGRLAPALGSTAEVGQLMLRTAAVVLAIIVWMIMSLPIYRRRSAA